MVVEEFLRRSILWNLSVCAWTNYFILQFGPFVLVGTDAMSTDGECYSWDDRGHGSSDGFFVVQQIFIRHIEKSC